MIVDELHRPIAKLKIKPTSLIDKSKKPVRNKNSEIHALTGLRGIAGLLVVLCHLSIPATILGSFPFFANIKEFGWFGVPIYFSLSGYLITWLALKEIRSKGDLSLKFFYLRRVLRVYPLYIFVCSLGLIAWLIPSLRSEVATSPIWILPLVTSTVNFSITFFNHWQSAEFLAIFWTLSLEEQFYIFWGTSLKWARAHKLLLIASAAIIFCIVWRLNPLPYSNFLEYRIDPPCSFATIMSGCILALLSENRKISSRFLIVNLTALALLGLVIFIALEWPFSTTTSGCFNTITSADILSCLLIFLCCQKLGLFTKIFNCKPLLHLGDISFCMYAINIPVIHFCNYLEKRISLFRELTRTHALGSFIAESLVIYLLIIAFGSLWIIVDRPITDLRYRLKQT